jgi:hypothetical protein
MHRYAFLRSLEGTELYRLAVFEQSVQVRTDVAERNYFPPLLLTISYWFIDTNKTPTRTPTTSTGHIVCSDTSEPCAWTAHSWSLHLQTSSAPGDDGISWQTSACILTQLNGKYWADTIMSSSCLIIAYTSPFRYWEISNRVFLSTFSSYHVSLSCDISPQCVHFGNVPSGIRLTYTFQFNLYFFNSYAIFSICSGCQHGWQVIQVSRKYGTRGYRLSSFRVSLTAW